MLRKVGSGELSLGREDVVYEEILNTGVWAHIQLTGQDAKRKRRRAMADRFSDRANRSLRYVNGRSARRVAERRDDRDREWVPTRSSVHACGERTEKIGLSHEQNHRDFLATVAHVRSRRLSLRDYSCRWNAGADDDEPNKSSSGVTTVTCKSNSRY